MAAVPAAIFVIRRCTVADPTETVFAAFATLPVPNATEFCPLAVVFVPSATAAFPDAELLNPTATPEPAPKALALAPKTVAPDPE
ncbi:hypothetical protein LXE92_20040 [Burkholderia contaminans]|nr:hypothetical protein [Burkholderia contaminans]WFN14197.1 hypothetical protein LXE92_20040 [Burkholderia contaminans]